MSYLISASPIGVDLSQIGIGSDTASKLIPAFAVGTRVLANDGVYQYCKALGTVVAGDLVKITVGAGVFTFVQGTAALIPTTEPAKLGVATTAFVTGQYGWLFVGPGLISINCLISCAQDVKLTAQNGGAVDDSGGGAIIPGLKLITTITAAAVSPCSAATELFTVTA